MKRELNKTEKYYIKRLLEEDFKKPQQTNDETYWLHQRWLQRLTAKFDEDCDERLFAVETKSGCTIERVKTLEEAAEKWEHLGSLKIWELKPEIATHIP